MSVKNNFKPSNSKITMTCVTILYLYYKFKWTTM